LSGISFEFTNFHNQRVYMNITFIGGGNMATALIGGLLQQGYSAAQIRVVEINAEVREKIYRKFSVEVMAELSDRMVDCNVILLAVKPQQLSSVAQELAPLLKTHLVISIVAGIRTTEICRWLGGYTRVIRAMPNTPALIRAAVTGLFALPEISSNEKHDAEAILSAVGSVLWFEREELLDAVTAVSGSGPAYVFYFIEAMQQAGRELGLDETQARQLSLETFLGAAKLAIQSNENVTTLRDKVTSKNGTTERAIQTMENDGINRKIIRAIHASNERARELGNEFSNK
jgi:pyrroline-5-carboxylate reductase